ncbi:MAG: helix-turn-helix domain-containing protein [Ruminococcus sp.]|nr:helix-turn-helix domain-containing protein [Ruminococcus sp.]
MYETLLKLCQSKKISITNLCLEITGSRGNLSTWKKGNINPASLIKIADYFDVSTDYLLGRTDSPQGISQINTGDVGDHSNVNVHNEKKTTDSDSDDTVSELVAVFKTLNFYDKAKVMSLIAELSNK